MQQFDFMSFLYRDNTFVDTKPIINQVMLPKDWVWSWRWRSTFSFLTTLHGETVAEASWRKSIDGVLWLCYGKIPCFSGQSYRWCKKVYLDKSFFVWLIVWWLLIVDRADLTRTGFIQNWAKIRGTGTRYRHYQEIRAMAGGNGYSWETGLPPRTGHKVSVPIMVSLRLPSAWLSTVTPHVSLFFRTWVKVSQ